MLSSTQKKRIEAEGNCTSIVKINEQCSVWKNNGKLKEQNRCKTCKQQKRLFKMDVQAKLYVTQNI